MLKRAHDEDGGVIIGAQTYVVMMTGRAKSRFISCRITVYLHRKRARFLRSYFLLSPEPRMAHIICFKLEVNEVAEY